jgi:hypothetical protein
MLKRLLTRALRPLGLQPTPIYPLDLAPAELEIWNQVWPFTMTNLDRFISLVRAVEYISANRIPGSVVECGVWRGGSAMAIALTLKRLGDFRDLYLFDTFQGMTAPTAADTRHDGETAEHLLVTEREHNIAFSDFETTSRNMARTGYPSDRVHFVPGAVEQTIPGHAPEQIALLRLDTDWYESTKHELEHLEPRLAAKGVLIIDDYGHWQGARKAVDEYYDAHRPRPLLQRVDYSARMFVKG